MRWLTTVAALVSEIQDDGKHECEECKHHKPDYEASNGKPGASLAGSLAQLP